jgi:hypothetical protein
VPLPPEAAPVAALPAATIAPATQRIRTDTLVMCVRVVVRNKQTSMSLFVQARVSVQADTDSLYGAVSLRPQKALISETYDAAESNFE